MQKASLPASILGHLTDWLSSALFGKTRRALLALFIVQPEQSFYLQQIVRGQPVKRALAARLRKETTWTLREIAQRRHLGNWKSLNHQLYLAGKARQEPKGGRAGK